MRMSREGFILPTVLLVLILFTAAAMAAAAMAHQQVRSASSLRVSVMAFHAAEGGASWIVNGFADGSLSWGMNGVVTGSDIEDISADIPWNENAPAPHGDAVWWVESITFAGDEATILVHGELQQLGARRTIETVVDRGAPDSQSPWAGAIVGCDAVNVNMSGTIDSWNSMIHGPYSPTIRQANALVSTLNPGSDVNISMSAEIHGDVIAMRDMGTGMSARVYGDIHAGRNISLGMNAQTHGHSRAVGNMTLGMSSHAYGDVEVGGTISYGMSSAIHGDAEQGADVDAPEPLAPCDPLDIVQLVNDSIAHYRPPGAPFPNWSQPMSSTREILGDTAVNNFTLPMSGQVTLDAGSVNNLFIDGSVDMGMSSRLNITNPSVVPGSPQELNIFINGNFSMGMNSQLNVDDGIAVRVYVTGNINPNMSSSINVNSSSPTVVMNNGQVVPSLGIFASTDGSISLGMSGGLTASLYAPRAAVSLGMSGDFHGAVVGRTVTASMSGGIHYDEALQLVSGGPVVAGGGFRVVSWEEVRGGS